MARLTIHLVQAARGGERVVQVALESDEDATPREHEQDHRRAVERLLPGVNLEAPGGRCVVERVKPAAEPCLGCSGGDDGYEVIDLG